MRSGIELIGKVQAIRPISGSDDDPLGLLERLTNKDRKAILNDNPVINAMRNPSPEAASAPLQLPSEERIKAALAAAKARGSGLESELKEVLEKARKGDRDAINLFNVVANSLLTNT
jgi:hypothetical protein